MDHALQTRKNLECLRVLLPKELLGGLNSLILDIFKLESKENWVVTDTLTAFYATLQTYFDNQILPWKNKNLEIQKLLISSKESEELTRILQILNNEIKANFLQINLNSITFVFNDLIKIQTVFARMLENPSEHYKPVKKALKDATTAQEIRTLLAL
jgi:hypothetical protein